MSVDRRTVMGAAPGLIAGAAALGAVSAASDAAAKSAKKNYRKIATEEACTFPDVARALSDFTRTYKGNALDMLLIRGTYGPLEQNWGKGVLQKLLDVNEGRLKDMDENNVSMHLLSLTSPGVQMFDADTANELATLANDSMADTIAKNPARFAGLASFAPQAPKSAAKEIERARTKLKMNGLIVNSHTNGEYLDDPKYWPILEAAEATDSALYIHPRCPSDSLGGPFHQYGMETAMWGYGVETSTHAVRMICNGVFDRFPKLKVVLGHMGEGLPFWLWRIDYMHNLAVGRGDTQKLQMKPSEYFKRNFAITTSGVEDHDALAFSIKKLGVENVIWAIDYPYQPSTPAVAFMDSAPIPDKQKALVYHGNAERIFHIKPA